MKSRFGLCLLPLLLSAAGCTTSENAADALSLASSDGFAVLPKAAPVPARRHQRRPRPGFAERDFSPDMLRSGSVDVVSVSDNPEVDQLIASYAATYEVPESLVRRVVKRESNFRPEARNGPYWGLMQILPATARGMGFAGPPAALLDAETNLKYAVKYLKGAYLVAGGDHDQAVRNYARGYYYDAKRKGLLEEAGLKRTRLPKPVKPEVELVATDPAAAAPAGPVPSVTSVVAERWDDGLASDNSAPPAGVSPAGDNSRADPVGTGMGLTGGTAN